MNAFPPNKSSWRTLARLFGLCLLFLLQFELLEVTLRAFYNKDNLPLSVWAPVIGAQRYVFSFGFVFLAAFGMLAYRRLQDHFDQLIEAATGYRWQRNLALQVLACSGFVAATAYLSLRIPHGSTRLAGLVAWGFTLCLTVVYSLLSLAPSAYWRRVLVMEKKTLFIALAAGLVTMLATALLIRLIPDMVAMTLELSAGLLQQTGFDVRVQTGEAILQLNGFAVQVTPECAGYEGMTLVTLFTVLYLWLFRDRLRFPAALVLFPLGLVAIWLLNSLRIALLVLVGAYASPEVAAAGFHSNAGWIAFILVSLALLWLAHHATFLQAAAWRQGKAVSMPHAEAVSLRSNLAAAMLLPMLVLMASSLLVSAASSHFDTLYPLKVIATAVAIAWFRPVLRFGLSFRLSWQAWSAIWPALATGALVFVMWIFLVPADAEKNRQFAEALAAMPPWAMSGWLFFRVVGACLTVPIAEELAFRGYVLARLSHDALSLNRAPRFSWLAVLFSSLLFGLFHGAWLAGTLAGLAYAAMVYYRGRLRDAILAHATTNALLSAWVLLTGNGSLW